jgi:hypothetical protein
MSPLMFIIKGSINVIVNQAKPWSLYYRELYEVVLIVEESL